MKIFKDFASYNKSIGLAEPLDNDIDVGYYDPPKIKLGAEPILVDFYRISIKINYKLKSNPFAKPSSAVFLILPI